jgi:hypothetical protein
MATKQGKLAGTQIVGLPMTLDRETKNTVRYAAADEDLPVTTVYINKSAFAGAYPETIQLTITA